MELERKFILTKEQATEFMERRLVFGVFKIFQGYFNLDDPNNEFRIRLSYPDTYHPKLSSFLTIKSKDINCGKRNEFEFSISAQDAFHTISKDCKKFIEREIRRGRKYDAIIMDPPSYGRGPTGEVWKIEDNIDEFVELSSNVLSENPLFFLLNSYTTGLSASAMKYITDARLLTKWNGSSVADELGLPVKESGLALPCGSSVRVCFEKKVN
jgi:CYTH domain-containing protein